MRKTRTLAAVLAVGCLLAVVPAADAQSPLQIPLGVSVNVTSQSASAPFEVTVDANIRTFLQSYAGSTPYSSAWLGNRFGSIAQLLGPAPGYLAGFYDVGYTQTTGGRGLFYPDPVDAVDWGDGAVIDITTVLAVPGGTGGTTPLTASLSHTYADDFQRAIQVRAIHPLLVSGEYYYGAPTTGQFVDSAYGTSLWVTFNGTTFGTFWFGGALEYFPMVMQNTAIAYAGNIGGGGDPIPTLSWVGLIALAGLLAAVGTFLLMRRS